MPWIEHTTNEESSMPTFNDSNNIPAVLAEGDFIFCVTGYNSKISQGQKTRGSDVFELELEIEPSEKRIIEHLIDHPSCNWKIDCFLKSAGVKLAKGEAFEFSESKAQGAGCKYVDPIGLRGWCRVTQEIVPPRDGKKEFTVNKIGTFYTDKPKLAARVFEKAEEDRPF